MNILDKIKSLFVKTGKTVSSIGHPGLLTAEEAKQISKYGRKIDEKKLIKELQEDIAIRIRINSSEQRVFEAIIRKPIGLPQKIFEGVINDYEQKGYKIIKVEGFPHIVIMSWF